MNQYLTTARLLTIAAIATFGLASCGDLSVTPGATTTTTRDVHGFSRIDITHGFDVTIIKDSVEGMTIEAPEGWQPRIKTFVSGGTLHLEVDGTVFDSDFSPSRATLHVKDLDGISASGATHISSLDTFRMGTITLEASGSSTINLRIATGTVHAEASGGSAITLAGTAQEIAVGSNSGNSTINLSGTATRLSVNECSGGSDVHAFGMPVTSATVDASGGSAIEVRASENLTATASGGSTVRYRGTPRITQHVSGGSQVVDAN